MMDRETWLERILDAIRDLGDAAYQERVWVQGKGPEVDSSTEAISRLYDDFDLVGFLAKSKQQRWLPNDRHATLQAFEAALSDYLSHDNDCISDASRVATPEWLEVRRLARQTLEAFAAPVDVEAAQLAQGIQSPCVSVGIPVFNGSAYVAEAIESVLAQTYSNFELLIQDNASTDGTEEICRAYQHQDPRVSYVRNEVNVGAIPNFNLVFQRARGRYFKWAAHDDICAPDFLLRCVEVLDSEPSVVLCTGQTQLIDDDGSPVGIVDSEHRAEGALPADRFWDVLVRTMRTFEIFGLIRSDVLRRTRLHEHYYGSDKVLLAELSLNGRFRLLPEVLLYRRCHPSQSSTATLSGKRQWNHGGFRPTAAGYVHAVGQAQIQLSQKLRCYGAIAYSLVAPHRWFKRFQWERYTET